MGRFKNTIRRIHHSIPPEVRKSYRFLVILVERIKKLVLPVYLCECRERESGELMRMLYIGWDKRMIHYWQDRFSDETGTLSIRSRVAPWNVCRYLERNMKGTDLAMVESYGMKGSCGRDKGFLLPRWMEMEVEMEGSLKKSRTKNIIRNIRKYGLTCEVSREMKDFELFYHRMYVPFVVSRHGMSADISDYKHFAGKFRSESSMLFFTIVDGKQVAAAYIEEKEEVHRLSAFGVLDGSEEVFRMGVVGALYYFVIQYFRERGEPSLLVGNSKPVVLDGVSEFKRQIGGAPYLKDLPRQQKLWFIPASASVPVQNILKNNPLYHLQDGALQMAVFLEDRDFGDQEEFHKFFKRLNTEQVATAVVYCLDTPGRIKTWLQGQPEIHIVDASRGIRMPFPFNS